MRPNFLGIGAQKCASTWLYAILEDHPEVCLSATKEIDFFSYFYDYGFEWYERQFANPGNRAVVGEVSPSYFHSLGAPERVFAYNPEMRLILFLRDPVERAISNHKHEIRIGHVLGPDLSFERGLTNNPSYVEQGLYATHLERWLARFPRERLLVLLVDDIVTDPLASARIVYRFLGVDDSHVSASLKERANESYVNRYRWLETARARGHAAVDAVGLGPLWGVLARAGGRHLYRRVNRRAANQVIPKIDEATRQRLRAMFRDEVLRLERILGRSLEGWR